MGEELERRINAFSALQRAENSSMRSGSPDRPFVVLLSVLFSEPKIPQFLNLLYNEGTPGEPFSALQRAENSSIVTQHRIFFYFYTFSALQRAENSSIRSVVTATGYGSTFSALQRAENSSILPEPTLIVHTGNLSVLFSEPKIPQYGPLWVADALVDDFQCSSASRKFLNERAPQRNQRSVPFQCSSASRKFLNFRPSPAARPAPNFQCSSASRKFLNRKSR